MPPKSTSAVPASVPKKLRHTLTGHQGPVHVVVYNKLTSKYCLSGGHDRAVRLWNPATGALVKKYEGHGWEVMGIAVSHDNARFASCGGDKAVFLWDVTEGTTIRRISGHSGKINAVAFNADSSVLASGSFDATVRLWDMRANNRLPIQVLEDAKDSIMSVHINGHYLYTGSVDGHARTYDLRAGQLRSDFLDYAVTSVTPTSDNTTLLCSTLDSTVRLLDAATGGLLASFKGHKSEDYRARAVFGPGEASVVSTDEEGRLFAWDLVDSKPINGNPPPKVHEKSVLWVEHHPTNQEMLSAGADGTIKVWEA